MSEMFDLKIDGVEVHYRGSDGVVRWMSDWTRCDEFAQRGYFRRIHRSGHGDPYAQTTAYYVASEDGCEYGDGRPRVYGSPRCAGHEIKSGYVDSRGTQY